MKSSSIIFLLVFLVYSGAFAQWSQMSISTSNSINDVVFVNSTTGFCAGMTGVFKTTNAGITWTLIPSSPQAGKFSFVSSSLGYVVNNTQLFKTTDGGTSWSQIYDFSSTGETLKDVCFTSSSVGFIITSYYSNPAASFIYKTTNGGTSWTKTNTYTGMATAESIEFVGTSLGFVVGYNGRVIRTVNAGSTWLLTQLPGVETLFSTSFVSASVGFAAGGSNFSGSEIIKTTDGGITWQQLSTGGIFNTSLRGIYFHSVDTGYAVGDNGRVIRTFDGGSTWQLTATPSSDDLYSVYFTTGLIGFASGENGTLLKTSNGGFIGIRELDQDELNIYPNPTINRITIESNDNFGNEYTLSLKNIFGQEVVHETVEFKNQYSLDLENIPNGIYFLILDNGKKQVIEKIVVRIPVR